MFYLEGKFYFNIFHSVVLVLILFFLISYQASVYKMLNYCINHC